MFSSRRPRPEIHPAPAELHIPHKNESGRQPRMCGPSRRERLPRARSSDRAQGCPPPRVVSDAPKRSRIGGSSTPALALLLSIVSTPSGAHGWIPAIACRSSNPGHLAVPRRARRTVGSPTRRQATVATTLLRRALAHQPDAGAAAAKGSDLVELVPELARWGIPRSWLKRELWHAEPRAGYWQAAYEILRTRWRRMLPGMFRPPTPGRSPTESSSDRRGSLITSAGWRGSLGAPFAMSVRRRARVPARYPATRRSGPGARMLIRRRRAAPVIDGTRRDNRERLLARLRLDEAVVCTRESATLACVVLRKRLPGGSRGACSLGIARAFGCPRVDRSAGHRRR